MINRLIERIQELEAPIVVGLDPQMTFIPEHIKKAAFEKEGETLRGAAEALFVFNKAIIDAIYDLVPCVKPQIAMYERYGVPGLMAYEKTIRYAKEKGLLVLGDIKRGDIGSTSGAYADGHLGEVEVGKNTYAPFDEDFATVNPYLGSDGVKPFTDVCQTYGKGIFVLVKTSNPSSGEFQDQWIGEKRLSDMVAEKVEDWGKDLNAGAYSAVGAVVGATYPEDAKRLRALMPHAYILVPGYGAQGGTGKDLVNFFNPDGLGAIVNSSRGIIAAWTKPEYKSFGPERFAEAAREAVLNMKADIKGALEEAQNGQ